ncbi:MAG: HAD family phosphatase [Syntrophobacteraceae bacterium]
MKQQHPGAPLEAVIFDCDGILVDTEPLHYRAFQKVLVPLGLGHDFEHYMDRFIGFDDRDAFLHAFREGGRELDPETLEIMIEAKGNVLQKLIEQGVPTFPGVVELVRDIEAHGLPMAVASGALGHEVRAFIKSLGLSGAFCAVVAADDVKKSKPDPETYVLALRRLREARGWAALDPASCVAIEDTPAGIHSARAAGLFVIGVTNSFPASDLRDADHVVASLAGLDFSQLTRLLERGPSR